MPDRCLLLVEGEDELHVLGHLLDRHSIRCARFERSRIPQSLITIKDETGFETLRDELGVYLAFGEQERLGVVIDADQSAARKWQSLRDVLRQAGYSSLPVRPDAQGIIVEQSDMKTVGIWIMPDNAHPGALEDFVGSLIPVDDVLWPRARNPVNRIPQSDRRFPANQVSKAHIHTWLAWQERPGTPMGSAIHERWLDADAPPAQRLIAWVRTLFAV
jgi:hypothetical protein